MRILLLLAVFVGSGLHTFAADAASEWQIKTLFTDNQVVSNGGIAADTQAPDIVYVSSKTQRVIWRVDLKARAVAVLAGQLKGPAAIIDGAAAAASFSQPRGICQNPSTHDLLVLDGIGNTAVLRKVEANTGTVSTILGNPSGAKPVDGSGSAAVLSSGSWWLLCQADGSVVLSDSQIRGWRHICPPGWSTDSCGSITPSGPAPTPPPPPTPAPPPPAPGPPGACPSLPWWQLLLSGLGGAVVGGAAVGGLGRYVRNKIATMRQKHSSGDGPGGSGGAGAGGQWGDAPAGSIQYEVLPGSQGSTVTPPDHSGWTVHSSNRKDNTAPPAGPPLEPLRLKGNTSTPAAAIQSPGGPMAQATSLEQPTSAAAAAAANGVPHTAAAADAGTSGGVTSTQDPWNLKAAGRQTSNTMNTSNDSGNRFMAVVDLATAAATLEALQDSQSGSHQITVETFRKGSGSLHSGVPSVPPPAAAAAGGGGSSDARQNMTGSYSIDIHDTNAYEALPTGGSSILARGGSTGSNSSNRVSQSWLRDQQQQRQPLHRGPDSVSWPVGDADGQSSSSSVALSRSSLDGSEVRSLLGTAARRSQQ